jgi:hypothetical protein
LLEAALRFSIGLICHRSGPPNPNIAANFIQCRCAQVSFVEKQFQEHAASMAEISQWRSLIKIDDLSMKAEKGGVSFGMLWLHFFFHRVTLAWWYYVHLCISFFRIALSKLLFYTWLFFNHD